MAWLVFFKQVIFSSSLPSARILIAHALMEFLKVSDFNESQAFRIHLTIIFRSGDFKIPASVTTVTTDNMTAKILSAELKKKKEKYKHFDLELLTERACKTPVFTNKDIVMLFI